MDRTFDYRKFEESVARDDKKRERVFVQEDDAGPWLLFPNIRGSRRLVFHELRDTATRSRHLLGNWVRGASTFALLRWS